MMGLAELMGIKIFNGEDTLATAEIAHVAMREDVPVGIWVPKLTLRHDVVREIVALQTTPFRKFSGVRVSVPPRYRELETISMIWGDFMLYSTGRPEIADFYGLPGRHTVESMMEPTIVGKAMDQLKELKEVVKRWKQH